MKEMYRREKRRIRFERWSWITITWILYLIKLQGQVPSFYSQHYEERTNTVSYTHLTLPTILRV